MAADRQLTPEEANAPFGEAVGALIERGVAVYATPKEAAKTQPADARSAEAQAVGGGIRRFVQMLRRQSL